MDYVKIGTIVNTRGIHGELKVRSLTDFQSDYYQPGNEIYILYQDKYLSVNVKRHQFFKNQDLIILNDYEDINLVEKFKGSDVFVNADQEMTFAEDEYHISEIIGLKVYQAGKMIGEVSDVREFPQGDYLEVLQTSGKKSLIPFRDEFVIDFSLNDETIEIVDMEGLL